MKDLTASSNSSAICSLLSLPCWREFAASEENAPLLSALDAHEIPFFGLEERPQDTSALISAFLEKEAGRDDFRLEVEIE